MSKLKEVYNKLTNKNTTGVLQVEDTLLQLGNIYAASVIEIPFASSGTVDFIMTVGSKLLAINLLEGVSNSEEFKMEIFVGTQFTGGTDIAVVNQFVGSSNVNEFTITQDPSISVLGSAGTKKIVRGITGRGNGGSLSSSNDTSSILVAPNVPILLRVTNQGSSGELDFEFRGAEIDVD